jgi:hypothetical protein
VRLCIQFNGIRSTKVQQIFLLLDYYQLPDILERSGYGFNLSINNECNFSGLIVAVKAYDFDRAQKGMLAVKNVVRSARYS